MGHLWESSGHDLTDAGFGLTDVGFGLMGEEVGSPKSEVGMGSNVQVQVSSSKGSGIVGFGFQVLGFRLRMCQFTVDFILLNEVKHLLWVGILQTLRVFGMTSIAHKNPICYKTKTGRALLSFRY